MKPNLLPAAAAAVAALALTAPAPAAVIYVNAQNPGPQNGLNWGGAYRDLADALGRANPGDEIWIAQGTYFPPGYDTPFDVPTGVKLFGGFDGSETARDQRDPSAHLAVLDGDFNGDDQPGFLNRADNARRILEFTNPDAGSRLDGLVITGGYANTAAGFTAGGGLLIDGGTLTIDQCLFIGNGAEREGGAVRAINVDSVRFRDSIFIANSTNPNSSLGSGGAVWVGGAEAVFEGCEFALNASLGGTSSFGGAVTLLTGDGRFSGCTFTANIASEGTGTYGGAVHTVALSVLFEDCVFNANLVSNGTGTQGGAVNVGGGAADFARCIFEGNTAEANNTSIGGAIAVISPSGAPVVRLGGCQFLGNSADLGGAVGSIGETPTIRIVGSLLAGNAAASGAGVRADGTLSVRNSTIAFNTPLQPSSETAGISAPGAVAVILDNTILWGNGTGPDQVYQINALTPPIVNHSCVQGWTGSLGGAGNFAADPLFVDPDGPDNVPGNADDLYTLRPFSPCIDAGDNTAVPLDPLDLDADADTAERLPIDVYGRDRRRDDPDVADTGTGNAPIVDIGAVELQRRSCPADLDVNGLLDLTDITLFIAAFTGLDLLADLDENGIWDLADIVLFVGFFNAGCP